MSEVKVLEVLMREIGDQLGKASCYFSVCFDNRKQLSETQLRLYAFSLGPFALHLDHTGSRVIEVALLWSGQTVNLLRLVFPFHLVRR